MNIAQIKERLGYLRGEIEAERISYVEVAELQSLAEHIDPDDVVLLQWAGVPEGATRKLDISAWTQDWQKALNEYAAAKGKDWLKQLTIDWMTGGDIDFPMYGHILRQIRNDPEYGYQISDAAWDWTQDVA